MHDQCEVSSYLLGISCLPGLGADLLPAGQIVNNAGQAEAAGKGKVRRLHGSRVQY
jgi:hypothetical protein